jgi:uncharacterized protein (TIGR02246 family)
MRLFPRPFLIANLVLAGLGLGPAVAGAQTAAAADPAVLKVADDYTKATLAGDVKAIAALYTEDGIELPPNHPPVKGRAAIEAYYTEQFASAKATSFVLTHWESATHGSAAFDVGAYKQTMKPGDAAAMSDTGKYAVILKKVGGVWKVAYAIYNSDQPPAAPPAQK